MKALIIYDVTGRIWNIIYGELTAPQGLTCMFVDIPDGAQLDHIDITNPEFPEPVFTYLPETDIGRLQKQITLLQEELTFAKNTIDEMKLNNDMAIAELTMVMADITTFVEKEVTNV